MVVATPYLYCHDDWKALSGDFVASKEKSAKSRIIFGCKYGNHRAHRDMRASTLIMMFYYDYDYTIYSLRPTFV